MDTSNEAEMLAQPASTWTFDFWKQQVESAPDTPAAAGRLRAGSQLHSQKYSEQRLIYLLEVASVEYVQEYNRSRAEVLAEEAYRMLGRFLGRYTLDDFKWMPREMIDRLYHFFKPKNIKTIKKRDDFGGDGEVSKTLRRVRNNLCWSTWKGLAFYGSSHSDKVKALHIFYAADRLSFLFPTSNYADRCWEDFSDVLPELEELAKMEMELSVWDFKSVEEAAYFSLPACLTLVMLRTILPAGVVFNEGRSLKENYGDLVQYST